MSYTLTILVAVAASHLAAAPAAAAGQRGHSAAPPVHATGPKSTTPPPRTARAATPSSAATPGTAVNPIAAKIATMPQLNARVTALLPANMTLNTASAGFKNQGQFIAALHVSRNLGIPFADLQNDMTTKHMSLGQSIQLLKKSADAPREVKRGETEASEDLKPPKRGSGR